MKLGAGPVAPRQDRGSPGERQARRRQRPAVALAGQHRRLVEHQGLALDPPAAGDPDRVGRNVGQGREGEGGAAPAGEGGADLADAVDQPGVRREPRQRHRARGDSARIDGPGDGGPVLGEDDGAVRPAAAHRECAGEIGTVRGQMRFDALSLARGGEIERPAERSVGEGQPSGEPVRVGAQVAAGMRTAGVEGRDRDHRRPVAGNENSAVAGEGAELRAAVRAIVEACRGRGQKQAHRPESERVVGAFEEEIEPRPLDSAVEDHPYRPVFRLAPARDDVEGAVAEALPAAREPQLRRIELQVGEVDDAVIAAFEVGGERGQPAGQLAKKAVVEPPDPCPGRADDVAALVVRTGHDVEFGDDVDDPEAGDQIALHRARQEDVEPAGHEVDQQRDLAGPFRAGEPEPVAPHELGRDRQPALDPGIGEHRPGDVADAGDRAGLQPERDAHRPGRQPAPPLGANVDEAGVVEPHLRRGQAIRIVRGGERPVERPHHAHVAAGHVREQRRRLQQVEPEPHAAVAVAAEVERSLRHRA